MIDKLMPHLLNFYRRRWAYAVGEVVSILVFTLCSSVLIRASESLQGTDFEMSKFTAVCFMALSGGTFTLTVCLKKIDKSDVDK